MEFEKEYLIDFVRGKTRGDFKPFSLDKWSGSDKYLKQVVGKIKNVKTIKLEADFDHYGSGTSSYIHIYLSKRDKSDSKIIDYGELRTEDTNGLMIYLCRLAPFAVYGKGWWSKTFKTGKWQSGGHGYIEVEKVGTTPEVDWTSELVEISNILNRFGIRFLTREELDKELEFEISIPTVLGEPPYKVFDCLFYWED